MNHVRIWPELKLQISNQPPHWKRNIEGHEHVQWAESDLRSLLMLISSGGMVQGRLWGRHANTSSENSEKSTSYSVRIPSVSGSISPA